jgi:hypothetical protein
MMDEITGPVFVFFSGGLCVLQCGVYRIYPVIFSIIQNQDRKPCGNILYTDTQYHLVDASQYHYHLMTRETSLNSVAMENAFITKIKKDCNLIYAHV